MAYAAIRFRFGPGAKTAAIVALFAWNFACFCSTSSMMLMGFYPAKIAAAGVVSRLGENVHASIAGTWLYAE